MKAALIIGALLIVASLAIAACEYQGDIRTPRRSSSERARGIRRFFIGVAIAMLGIIIAAAAAVIHALLPWLGRF